MKKWEYTERLWNINFYHDYKLIEGLLDWLDWLNKQGAEGWELIEYKKIGQYSCDRHCLFKREVE